MGKATAVRVLVADGDVRVRSAVHTLLMQEPEPIVVRECSNVGSLATQVQGFLPDVMLLDSELPGRPAAALLFACHGLESRPKVIILSARPQADREAMDSGADGFVSQGDPPERFLAAFRRLVRGLSSEIAS
jgi:DNA-binding NarL/FixJ family response regulator